MLKESYTILEEQDFKIEAEITSSYVTLIKKDDDKIENIVLSVWDLERLLAKAKRIKDDEEQETLDEKTYDEPVMGISIMSGEPVEIIGEQTVKRAGRILEQYLYNIVGYTPANGKSFASLKANIILTK